MGHDHVGPELADAAGGKVGVPIEVAAGLQGDERAFVLSGKRAQVGLHALGQGEEEDPDARPVVGRELPVGREACRKSEEKITLGRDPLRPGQALGNLGEARGRRQVQLLPQ